MNSLTSASDLALNTTLTTLQTTSTTPQTNSTESVKPTQIDNTIIPSKVRTYKLELGQELYYASMDLDKFNSEQINLGDNKYTAYFSFDIDKSMLKIIFQHFFSFSQNVQTKISIQN